MYFYFIAFVLPPFFIFGHLKGVFLLTNLWLAQYLTKATKKLCRGKQKAYNELGTDVLNSCAHTTKCA
jgi:hypothetical protein